MTLTDGQLAELESIAIRAARQAGAMIRAEVGKPREAVHKAAGSSEASQVVTEVDFESQRIILETLAASTGRYQLGLLTEERADDSSRLDHDHFWCVDPLDGTLPFSEGRPGYSVSIALVSRAGDPLIGVVFDPVANTLYQGRRGAGAFRNGEPWKPSRRPGCNTLTLVMDRSFTRKPDYQARLARIGEIAARAGLDGIRPVQHGGAVLNACHVAENAPALYFKFPKTKDGGGSIWDFAASACLFRELGLPCTDIHGSRLPLNSPGTTFMNRCGVVFATDSKLALAARGLYES